MASEIIESISAHDPSWLKDRRVGWLKEFENTPSPQSRYGLTIRYAMEDMSEAYSLLPSQDEPQVLEKPVGVEILSLEDAYKKYPFFCEKNILSRFLHGDQEKNIEKNMEKNNEKKVSRLTAHHAAHIKNGLFIRVPENYKSSTPLCIESRGKSIARFDYVFVWLQKNSSLDVLFRVNGDNLTLYRSEIIEILAEDNSTCKFGSIQNLGSTLNFQERCAYVEKNAKMMWFDAALGSSITRSSTSTVLHGEGSAAVNTAIGIGDKSRVIDMSGETIHEGINSSSDARIRLLSKDVAKVIFRGLIHMTKNASSSNGFQKADSCIMSPKAEAHVVPNLEINNHDVKCTHGASVTQVDAEKLFYAESRGISRRDAVTLFVEGFFEPMLKGIQIHKVQEELRSMIKQKVTE
jgi:Fe-S cluster assembly protein SufD